MFKTISVIGGDLRQLTAANLLKNDGFDVILYGFEQSDTGDLLCEDDICRALDADAVILPLPVSFDGEFLNAPFSKKKHNISEIIDNLNPAAVVFGGQIKENITELLEKRKIKYCDYLNREELAIKNAVPTAFMIWV